MGLHISMAKRNSSAEVKLHPTYGLASFESGKTMQNSIESQLGELTSKNDDAAKFAYDESKASYDLTRERFKSLDAKAVTLTGIITTGLGAIALLGDPAKVPAHGFWIYVALGALCGALVGSLCALAPRGIANPDLSPYVWPATLANVDNLARVRVHVARAWLRDSAVIEHTNAVKGKRLQFATMLLVTGLAGLILNSIVAKPGEQPALRVIVGSPAPETSSSSRAAKQ